MLLALRTINDGLRPGTDAVAEWARRIYGIRGPITALPGERDCNFLCDASGGDRVVLKAYIPHIL
jgi:Ser/Thr protein kinase RdoA (MazF antagonist)